MKTLKEFAYLHLRANGLSPKEALRYVRIAITASASGSANWPFESAINFVCHSLCLPIAFNQ